MVKMNDTDNVITENISMNEDIKQIVETRNFDEIDRLSEFSNSKIKRVVLQIGMDKTATTSIQLFLSENRPWLNQNSLEYRTDWGANNHSVPLKSIVSKNPEKIYWHIVLDHSNEQILDYNYGNLLALCNGIKTCQSENYIFFGEGICGFRIHELENLKKLINTLMPQARIEVLFCARSIIGYASSGYQQAVRMGRSYSENKLLVVYSNIYFRKLFRVVKVFGKKRIKVYRFEDTKKHKYGPVGYFIQLLGISTREIGSLTIPRANESISFQATEIIEFINATHPLIKNNKKNSNRFKGDIDPITKIKGAKYQLSSHLINRLSRCSMLDILWLRLVFKIKYPIKNTAKNTVAIDFDEGYVQDFLGAYNASNDFIKAGLHNFIKEKIKSSSTPKQEQMYIHIGETIKLIERSDYEKSLF